MATLKIRLWKMSVVFCPSCMLCVRARAFILSTKELLVETLLQIPAYLSISRFIALFVAMLFKSKYLSKNVTILLKRTLQNRPKTLLKLHISTKI